MTTSKYKRNLPYKSASGLCSALTVAGEVTVTPLMIQVLIAINVMNRDRGYTGFTTRELCRFMGSHIPTDYRIHQCIWRLHRLGLVSYEKTRARTLRPSFQFIPADQL